MRRGVRAGSLAWLLRHELRIAWRELTATISAGWLVLFALLVLAMLHAALFVLLQGVRVNLVGAVSPEVIAIVGVLLLVLFPLALTFGINRSVLVFYERGDMDLLAASPLPPRIIFASRVLSVATTLLIFILLLAVPIAGAGLLVGVPRLLGAYPVAVAFALAAASLGMLIMLALVRLLGAQRARVLSQVLAAVAGASLFLLTQLPNLLGRGAGAALEENAARLATLFEEGGALGPGSVLWLPARALFLDPLAVVLVLAGAGALTWATVASLQGAFMHGSREVASASRRRAGRPRPFAGGVARLVLVKEWRLILRDPYLISQVLLQLVYMVPVLFLVLAGDSPLLSFGLGPGVAGALVLLSASLVSALARIVFSGEDAPDLLTASPVATSTLQRLKLVAVLAPVWLVAAGPLGLILSRWPELGAFAIVGFVAATMSAAHIRLWNPAPAPRADLFKQKGQRGDPVMGFLEVLTPLAWVGGVALFGSGFALAGWLPVIGLAALGVAYVYSVRRL